MKGPLFFSVVVIVAIVSSCGTMKNIQKKATEHITGTWKIKTIESNQLSTDMQEQVSAILKTTLDNSQFAFNPDNSYLLTIAGNVEKGNWKLSPDGKNITMQSDYKTNNAIISALTEDALILIVKEEEEVIYTMNLQKVK